MMRSPNPAGRRTRWLAMMWPLVTLTALSACLPADEPATSAQVIEHAWTLIDARYALFPDKPGVDWDAARERALARVAEDASEQALFDALASMVAELEDDHVNLRAPFDLSWQRQREADSPPTFDGPLVRAHVLGGRFRQASGALYGRLTAPDGASVAYLHLSDFNAVPGQTGLDAIYESFEGADRLIVDLRSNGGGALEECARFLSRLILTERVGWQLVPRVGAARDALGDPIARTVSPSERARFDGPLLVLTDRHTYSAANTAALVLAGRPQTRLVGLPTGGGGGAPRWFELPNGWGMRLPTYRLITAEGEGTEAGIAPDVVAEPDPSLSAQGRDAMIEAALREAW